MANASREKELTFKLYAKPREGGRWCKRFDKTTAYFGTGKNKSDDASYRAALKVCRKRMEVVDEEDRFRQMTTAMY